MKHIILMLTTLFCSALFGSECQNEKITLSPKQAESEGITFSIERDLPKKGCHQIGLFTPPEKANMAFGSMSVYLHGQQGLVSAFSPRAELNHYKQMAAPITVCDSSVESIKVTIYYGERCNSKNYVVGIVPSNL